MTGALTSWRTRLRLTRLTGPILDKDLRVESRRRRTYVLRFVYVAILAGLIGLAWMAVGASNVSVWQTQQMAAVGQSLVHAFIVFQFVAAQVMAVVSLSTAVSDEIQHRTLGVLMTTPITGPQIVIGKLLSRLLHILLLLALCLPVLAIVRVFGGVAWNVVIAGLAVTTTATVFAGSVCLFFSIRSDRAYAVILRGAFAVGVLYVLIPFVAALAVHGTWALLGARGWQGAGVIVKYVSPVMALSEVIRSGAAVWGPGPRPPTFFWPIHCVLMLLGSTLVLMIAARQVRRVALRQATGQIEAQTTAFEDKIIEKLLPEPPSRRRERPLRPVQGPPVIWKELAAPLIPGRREKTTIGLVVAALVLALLYGTGISQHNLNEDVIQVAYVTLFMGMGTLVTILLVSTPITSEKEAGTWPILLATPVTDRDILAGKAIGALRRCGVVWAFLAVHLLLSVALGYVHWIAIIQIAIIVTGLVAFTCGTGLYLSSRFRRTTPAVVLNVGLAMGLWFVLPSLLASGLVLGHYRWGAYVWLVNPFIQAGSVIRASCELSAGVAVGQIHYPLPLAGEGLAFGAMMGSLLVVTGVSLLICLTLLALAQRRLRREIF